MIRLAIFFVTTLFTSFVFGQSPATKSLNIRQLVTDRVGKELDKAELEYFGIFTKNIEQAPVSFIFEPDNSLTYTMIVNGTPTRFNVDPRMADAFARHISLYEYFAKNEEILNATAVKTFSLRTPIKRYERNGNEALIVLTNDSTYAGEILTIKDSLIAFWPLNVGYDPYLLDTNVVIAKIDQVKRLYIYKNLPIKWFLGSLGVATAVALYSSNVAFPDLKNEAATLSSMIALYGALGYGIGSIADKLISYRKLYTPNQIKSQLMKFERYAIFGTNPPPELVRLLAKNNLR